MIKSKFKKLLAFTILGSVIAASSVYASNSVSEILPEQTTLPSKQAIKEGKHFKKIMSLKEKTNDHDEKKAIQSYLKGLNEKELFETAAEMIEAGTDFERDGMILVPFIKDKWKDGASKEAHKMLRDKGYNPVFRQHILDAMTRNDIKEKSLNDDAIVAEMTTLINDQSEDEHLRSYALKKLNKSKKVNHNKLKLENIVFNESEPLKVRGSAIVAMNRTKDINFEKTLDRILKNKEVTDVELIKYAIVEAGKSRLIPNYYKELKEISALYQSAHLDGTMIYALTIIGDKEAVKLSVDLYHEEEKEVAQFAYRYNMFTVLELLDSPSPEDIKYGIKAATYGNIANAIPTLENLVSQSKSEEIKQMASGAIQIIDPNALVDLNVLEKEGK